MKEKLGPRRQYLFSQKIPLQEIGDLCKSHRLVKSNLTISYEAAEITDQTKT